MPDLRIDLDTRATFGAADWRDLVARAEPNVFLDPAALNAIADPGFAPLRVLTAWDTTATPHRLAGVWALALRGLTPLGPRFLSAPVHNYAFVGNPVVDPAFGGSVVAAFFERIAAEPGLPRLLRLRQIDGAHAASHPLFAALDEGRGRHRILSTRERPFATPDAATKRSGSTRKKLRQDWNRLAKRGAVTVVNGRNAEAVRTAFETFLKLEEASWKGAGGTALLSRPSHAAFARRMAANLSTEGTASVALLELDGRAIAAQVLLYCGDHAYTWKTAYDADFARFSPGALLVDRITTTLFTDGFAAIESCSPDGGFMSGIWEGRRTTFDLLVDVGTGRSPAFAITAAQDRACTSLKAMRNRVVAWRAAKPSAAGA